MKLKVSIIAFVMIMLIGIVNASSISRSLPSSPTGDFNVIYQATSTGTWGASIIDAVSGGCTFPDGSIYQTVMLSTDGSSKTVVVKKNSASSCSFHGDYKFGIDAIQNFPDATVTFGSSGTGGNNNGGTGGTSNGFCFQFADDLISKVMPNQDCQTNTIILIVGGVLLIIILLAVIK
jgi:hypothetical protein